MDIFLKKKKSKNLPAIAPRFSIAGKYADHQLRLPKRRNQERKKLFINRKSQENSLEFFDGLSLFREEMGNEEASDVKNFQRRERKTKNIEEQNGSFILPKTDFLYPEVKMRKRDKRSFSLESQTNSKKPSGKIQYFSSNNTPTIQRKSKFEKEQNSHTEKKFNIKSKFKISRESFKKKNRSENLNLGMKLYLNKLGLNNQPNRKLDYFDKKFKLRMLKRRAKSLGISRI